MGASWSPTGSSPAPFGGAMMEPSIRIGHGISGHPSELPDGFHRDMVFTDGMSLRQVASLSQVSAGTFYVDYTHHQL